MGAAVFSVAIALFLIGLTNKSTGEWTDTPVGGLMALGLLFGLVFIWIESRAVDPIVPLSLFRIRTFSISVAAMFLAGFGFFGAIIFLPRWFQVVAGASATESGYSILPLLFGLIFGAVASGQIVARTGRYKWLTFGSLLMLALGLFLMTNLHADTSRLMLSLWMLITGLGIGPSFAVFTLIVQNAVAASRVGAATSNLTFFQQIGGTIGLTIASTLFVARLATEVPAQLLGKGIPKEIVDQFGSGAECRHLRGRRSRPANPREHPARRAGGDRAARPGHRGRHLRGRLRRHRLDVLGRHHRRAGSGVLRAVPQGSPDARHVRGRIGRARGPDGRRGNCLKPRSADQPIRHEAASWCVTRQ